MSDQKGIAEGLDFDLPPLPKLKTSAEIEEEAKNRAAGQMQTAAEEEVQKKPLSIDDILSAPNNSGDVVIPKEKVDVSTVKKVSSAQSVDRTMAEAEIALKRLAVMNSTDSFETAGTEKKSAEIPKAAPPVPEPEEDVPLPEHNTYEPDIESIQLSDMDSKVSEMNSNVDEAARALKNMIMLDEMSMEMTDTPVLDEMSSEYRSDREKAKGDDFARKDTLSAREKKAIKDRMHEEIYRRPENFDKVTGAYLESKLKAENRLKKAKKGLLLNIFAAILILGCAAATYLGLHVYNELFTYLAALTLISGLMLLIRSKMAKIFTIVYLVLNTLTLAVPGLGLMILNQKTDPADNFDGLIVAFTICIVLSGLALFILSTSKLVAIYFTTDNEGNEKK